MGRYQYSDEELYLLENSSIPFAVYQFVDERVVTIALSVGFCEMLGITDKKEAYDLMDNNMYRDAHPDDVARISDIAWQFATGKTEKYEAIYRSKRPGDDKYFVIHAQGEHKYTDTGERIAVIWYTDEGYYNPAEYIQESDLNLNEKLSEALQTESLLRASYFDTLTGLPNMVHFFQLVETEREKAKETGAENALLFLNLNDMKSFNRKYGYAKGDYLLIAVAKMLSKHFGSDNCSRFGQDQFTVFVRANRLEDKIRMLFAENELINDGHSLPMRIGIYFDDNEKVDIGMACDRAKMAADSCKQAHFSTFACFNQNLLDFAERKQYIIEHLDQALEEEWIQIYYQPIVRATNGRVCDEEALARWMDPRLGLLPPLDFIPILEEEKLIYKVDLYAVDKIIEKIQSHSKFNLPVVPASVNLSRSDFDACDIVEEIRKRVDDAGIGRENLVIEITESVIGSDFDFMKEQIQRFHDLGFKVWMDDFGSGYSSLDVLQGIPFDLIKFDMHFMRTFSEGDSSKIILTELTRMALGLGTETVTEGVETEEQLEFLKEIGCAKVQGFYYCPPIPFEQIISRYESGTQIGFENPEESQYYATLGSVNLYDMSVIAAEDDSLKNYFTTIPMAVIETNEDEYSLIRWNSSCKSFYERIVGEGSIGMSFKYGGKSKLSRSFVAAIRQCGETGVRSIIDEELKDGSTMHVFMRRVAINPISNAKAVVVAILAVSESNAERGTTYEHITKALASDYTYLYYVNTETNDFIEYSKTNDIEELSIERRGTDFFDAAAREAIHQIHPEDLEKFLNMFTKENVLCDLESYGSFTITYRLLSNNGYKYVNMKVMKMKQDKFIIIGVRDVDEHQFKPSS